MSANKGSTEGGSGGKRGHSNMEHWQRTEEIKRSSRVKRRNHGKQEIAQAAAEAQSEDSMRLTGCNP
ncbi:MAG: hypothetical protein CO187_09440 [Zetaproteobacteria bacterium CG_4_9_14_3_um_filter_53_7]|nr:MAG: hypothetical protein CO187_09440 [Zetaproteobacteria bacterium CG_4_9_14_3_um_filter_53_7]